MCGDIMNIWNVQSVSNALNHLTGTVGVVQINVAKEQEQLQSKNTSRLIRAEHHSKGGLKAGLEKCVSGVTDKAKKAKGVLLYEPSGMKRNTQTKRRSGTQSTGIVGVAQMLAIWTGKLYQISLKHLVTSVRIAERLSELRLTISNRYQKVARTILITYNHCVNPVTQRKATDESHL